MPSETKKDNLLEITPEATDIAGNYSKKDLKQIAKDNKIDVTGLVSGEQLVQALLNGGIEFSDADQDDAAEKTDDKVDSDPTPTTDEDEPADDEDEPSEDDEDAEEEVVHGVDLATPPGTFIYKKTGTTASVYFPNGEFCREYTKKQVKDPASAAKLFCDKKNAQVAAGMSREGSKAKPQYPKGVVRPTNYKTS